MADVALMKKTVGDRLQVKASGGIHTPEQARKMLEIGAWAVVVGGAITRPLEIAQRFFAAIQ